MKTYEHELPHCLLVHSGLNRTAAGREFEIEKNVRRINLTQPGKSFATEQAAEAVIVLRRPPPSTSSWVGYWKDAIFRTGSFFRKRLGISPADANSRYEWHVFIVDQRKKLFDRKVLDGIEHLEVEEGFFVEILEKDTQPLHRPCTGSMSVVIRRPFYDFYLQTRAGSSNGRKPA